MPQCQCGPTEGGLDHLVHLVEKQLRAQLDPSRGRRGIGRWERHRVAIDVATVGRVDPATAGIGPPRSPGEVPGPQPPRRVPPWCGRADGSRGRLWRFVFCGARRDRASVPGSPFHSLRAPAAPGAAEGSRRLRACSCCACLGYRSFDRGCPVAHRIRVAACSVAVSAGTSSSASRAPCRPNRCMMRLAHHRRWMLLCSNRIRFVPVGRGVVRAQRLPHVVGHRVRGSQPPGAVD